jgi:hypothetical protein
MSELPLLVADLALIFAVTCFFSLLFKWLKQLVVLEDPAPDFGYYGGKILSGLSENMIIY